MSVIIALLLLAAAADDRATCKSPKTQSEMNFCAFRRYETADAIMNRQWEITLARSRRNPQLEHPDLHNGKSDTELMLVAQRAWITFRDKQCAYEESYMPGSGGPSMLYACLHRLTEDRTKELKRMAGN